MGGTCRMVLLSTVRLTVVFTRGNWAVFNVTVSVPVALTTTVSGEGVSDTSSVVGGVTWTAASALEPFRLAVTFAVPSATVPTVNGALVWFAGTVTVAGTVRCPAGVAVTLTVVSVDCAAEIVTVSVVVEPSVTEFLGGRSDTTVGRASVTATVLVVLVSLRLAVICTVPVVFAETVTDACVWPARTVTVPGTEAIPESVLLSDTVAFVVWAALIVTVNVPEPLFVMVRVAGERLVMVGEAGVTWTVLVAAPPFKDTVIMAMPALTDVTGTCTLLCPLAKDTDDGTVATLVLSLLTLSVPAAVGMGNSVVVRVPVAPVVMVSGFDVSVVGVGRILVPSTLIVR